MATLDGFSTALLTPSLGSLLHGHRTETGESAKSVSRRSSLGVVEIAQVELGRAELDTDELADAVGAYAVPRSLFPVGRCQVSVDLVGGCVSVHGTETDVAETAADRILLSYFELFFTARSMEPATRIPFTDLDLDVLRVVLSSRRREVAEHLHRMVGPFDDESLMLPELVTRRTARSALLVLAAAAATFAGGVVVHQLTSSGPTAPIEVQIGEAVMITR